MTARRTLTVILSVIALIMGGLSFAIEPEEFFQMVALGNLIVALVGFAVVLALIPDKPKNNP